MLSRNTAHALVLVLAAWSWAACTDSELDGDRAPRADVDATIPDDAETSTEEVTPDATVTTQPPTDVIVTTDPPDITTDATVVTDVTVTTDADVRPDAGCTNDEQCRDQIGEAPCRVARCELATGTCIAIDNCGDCQSDRDCDDRAERCQRGTCDTATGQCQFDVSGTCCSSGADCDDDDQCTTQTCQGGRCAYTRRDDLDPSCCVATPIIDTSFSPAPNITFNSQVDDAGWNVITTPFTPSPPGALFLGNPDTQRLASSSGQSYYASATMFAGRAAANTRAEVKFQVFMDLRASPADAVRVSLQSAVGTVFVFDRFSTAIFDDWHAVKVDVVIPAEADWSLVFEFNSNQPPDLLETGIYFDDVQVRLGCQEGGCEPGTVCPSDDPCQFGFCNAEGVCQFEDIPNCGCNDTSCDDGNPCTIDRCSSANECAHEVVPGCCDGDACCDNDNDCRDGNPCTLGTCNSGVCRQEVLPIPGCSDGCQEDDQCDDNNPCTEDRCTQQGFCANQVLDCDDGFDCTIDFCDPSVGCANIPTPDCQCVPQVLWSRNFSPGESPDIDTSGGTGDGIRWRVDALRAHSPQRAFRYGKESGEDYDNGVRTWGRATGPFIQIPESASGARLSFWTLVDVDDDELDRDLFVARVLNGPQNDPLWSRAELEGGHTNGEWRQITVDLPAQVIGQEIQIRWTFDSVDGENNDGSGVFIDDVELSVTCPQTL